MSDSTGGMGAEVGVRKIEDGDATETRGTATPPTWAYRITYLMIALSVLGLWKLIELILVIS